MDKTELEDKEYDSFMSFLGDDNQSNDNKEMENNDLKDTEENEKNEMNENDKEEEKIVEIINDKKEKIIKDGENKSEEITLIEKKNKQKEEENEKGEKKKKRKSRWGALEEEEKDSKQTRKSRWAPAMGPSEKQKQIQILQQKIETNKTKMLTVASDAALKDRDPNRSPSPPPQYDCNGKRLNTREIRMRKALEKERYEIIDELIKLNPLFCPPLDYLQYKTQLLARKIPIPVKEYPNYNFIGLIIGPRGNTQKKMEKETNTRICIRGKGSIKDSNKGKKLLAGDKDDDEDLHVYITGDKVEDIDKAEKLVMQILTPVEDVLNSHKQKQLRELALINGTLRDEDYCHICGEKGHRQWECPNRETSFKPVQVKCLLCGDASHPTSDCALKRKSGNNDLKAAGDIDKEYLSFMEQLGENVPNPVLKPLIPESSNTIHNASAQESISVVQTIEDPSHDISPIVAQNENNLNVSSAPLLPPPPPMNVQTVSPAPLGSTKETAYPAVFSAPAAVPHPAIQAPYGVPPFAPNWTNNYNYNNNLNNPNYAYQGYYYNPSNGTYIYQGGYAIPPQPTPNVAQVGVPIPLAGQPIVRPQVPNYVPNPLPPGDGQAFYPGYPNIR